MIALIGDLDAHIAPLTASAGYQFPRAFNGTLTHRRFLCYPSASVRTYHLHLVDQSAELARRLSFRDRLRTDSALAEEYVTLKRALAERHREDPRGIHGGQGHVHPGQPGAALSPDGSLQAVNAKRD
jgi:GrpB-like predicted nucleotidyltransferase (UPF0157 family)